MRNFLWTLLACLFCQILGGSIQAQQPYFQQDVKYEIHVRLDDQQHFLHASWKLDYTNNSPDTLNEMYLHLWPNAYRDRETAFGKQVLEGGSVSFYKAKDWMRGYIDSLEFKINGQPVWWNQPGEDPDIIRLGLPEPLLPGATVQMTTPFRVKIPLSYSRLGHVRQQYQLTQWYPKPAVYDRKGWHPMPYLDQGEFFSEFGTYDVYITLPANYVVGATGDLPDGHPEYEFLAQREVLTRERMAQKGNSNKTELNLSEILGKSTPGSEPIERPFPDSDTKVLHFHQEQVHDFAWFCDKDYYVLSDTVLLPESGREVRCVALFTDRHFDTWRKAPTYLTRSVKEYSAWNGEYPYRHCTAVDGALSAGAGMEYPNITVVSGSGGPKALDNVIMHEVGHNWFYGMLGSNERDYPWMDEGLNTFMENRYMLKYYPKNSGLLGEGISAVGLENTNLRLAQVGNETFTREGRDQPIQFPSADYTEINYGLVVYTKTGIALYYLEDYLGKEVTDRCFHTYFDRWKFRHPYPEDMQAVFEEVSGKDLDWFFEDVVQGRPRVNFKIARVKDGQVRLVNKTGFAMPAKVTALDKEGKVLGSTWTKPFEDQIDVPVPARNAHQVVVNREDILPDFIPKDNHHRTKGILKKWYWPSIRPLFRYPRQDRLDLNVVPLLGGNTTDGFIAGLGIHKGYLPTDRFRFHVIPGYGTRSRRLVGSVGAAYRWLPRKAFRKIELRFNGSAFSTLVRSRQALVLYPQVKNPRGPFKQRIALESHSLGGRSELIEGISPNNWYVPVFGRATWEGNWRARLYQASVRGETGANFSEQLFRASGSMNYRRYYGKKKKRYVSGRIFAGIMTSDGSAPDLLRYGLSGSGDPFGEHLMVDRAGTSRAAGQQLFYDHGGFSSILPDRFDRGLFSAQVALNTPFLFDVYGEVAYGTSFEEEGRSFYGTGLRVSFAKDALRINFPIVGSAFADDFPSTWEEFGNNISVSLDITRMVEEQAWRIFDFK